jgi:hypothetical protein
MRSSYHALVGVPQSGRWAVPASPRASRRDPAQRDGQGLPAGDGPGTGAGLRGVGDAGEQPAQLDRGRELAAFLVDGADRRGFSLGDDEHPASMGAPALTGKRTGPGDTTASSATSRR